MPDAELIQLWGELERRLLALMDSLDPILTGRLRDLVVMFIDHNEFGVAFETLRDGLIEEEIAVSQDVVQSLIELGRLMNLPAGEADLGRS